ncbi:hypothetical protein [Lederbergia citrea]|uniref:Uncharacterized protein n=1 Tax=Lederbergia citrea TaxID=2833581 RepID=A0A942Z3P8_9BACI|nr:hypothetical protein [Lederbergia citrea]MBS4177040.1 hypothetical protein [Lederbergia citrea]MBS4203702.1 hypothetical protein [Lederbergia citrea]MBS4221712.1 hypothetical protein [Lederbergia citrea]
MTVLLIIAAVFTIIVALVGTLLVGKDINSKMQQYEAEGDTLENELARSHEYESSSLRVNIKSLSWIYVALGIVVFLVCLGIFFY